MFYRLSFLTQEELENLYLQESQKLSNGASMNMTHNSLQSIRQNIQRLENEINQRKKHNHLQLAYINKWRA
jgi:hypothetical protein